MPTRWGFMIRVQCYRKLIGYIVVKIIDRLAMAASGSYW
jgi:hypothetical protein